MMGKKNVNSCRQHIKLRFIELLCSAQMGRAIRMELLATSS